ncbi:MAG: hypothetical protein JNK05_20845 [Myxococcales bacterium]|nr:hypothetical protein [Myxococcales bacterium]
MTYRDELQAAHARIQALEEQLARATTQDEPSLVATIAQLREELANARARIAAIEAAAASATQPRALWTLYEHNLRAPPLPANARNTEPAGVLCPRCFEHDGGAQVEMLRTDTVIIGSHIDEVTELATCPRCLFSGRMRTKV